MLILKAGGLQIHLSVQGVLIHLSVHLDGDGAV